MRERDVEKRFREAVTRRGGLAAKLVSPGNAGMPDRLVLLPVPEAHREIVSRYVQLVELKAPGGELDPLQIYWRDKLTRLGHCVLLEDGTNV